MDLRVLKQFLIVARERNFSRAAEILCMTQPPLSRNIRDLEKELGKQLFVRTPHGLELSEEGLILSKRAAEILQFVQKSVCEIKSNDKNIQGDVHIAAGESQGMREVIRTMKEVQSEYPDIIFHIYSASGFEVCERLDRGLSDFGLLIEPIDFTKYESLRMPGNDVWGILMNQDDSKSQLEGITAEQLKSMPLICSEQLVKEKGLLSIFGIDPSELKIVASYNLVTTPKMMVQEGMGYALTLGNLVETGKTTGLTFIPLHPITTSGMFLVWKKFQTMSKASELFRMRMKKMIEKLNINF